MIGLAVAGLSKRYQTGGKRVQALADVNFSVAPGTFVAVIGYSGCGKTTLIRHIAGLDQPDAGGVTFPGDFEGGTKRRARLGVMFQEPRLLPWLTVRENLALALRRTDVPDQGGTVGEALSLVGMKDFEAAYPDQLSGGMAQRAALARALCRKPDVLLMDEPFGALDALTRLQLQVELARIWSERPMTVLCITHDIGEAVILADRVLVMVAGRMVAEWEVALPRPRRWGQPEFEALRGEILDFILDTNNKERP